MSAQAIVAADPDAQQLGEALLDAVDVQEKILEETVQSAENGHPREAGRTACGSVENLHPPVERFERAVELSACPLGRAGIWHTHPTRRGLTQPVHSLPDWGNVIFHAADASVVVGTVSSELVVSPDNPMIAQAEFREAFGHPVESTEEIVNHVRSGQVDATAARRRVREALPGLVQRRPTPFPDLESRVLNLSIPAADTIHACGTAHAATNRSRAARRSMALHRRARSAIGGDI